MRALLLLLTVLIAAAATGGEVLGSATASSRADTVAAAAGPSDHHGAPASGSHGVTCYGTAGHATCSGAAVLVHTRAPGTDPALCRTARARGAVPGYSSPVLAGIYRPPAFPVS